MYLTCCFCCSWSECVQRGVIVVVVGLSVSNVLYVVVVCLNVSNVVVVVIIIVVVVDGLSVSNVVVVVVVVVVVIIVVVVVGLSVALHPASTLPGVPGVGIISMVAGQPPIQGQTSLLYSVI